MLIPSARTTLLLVGSLSCAIAAPLGGQQPASQSPAATLSDPDSWSALSFRYIGPAGNRVSAVAGIAGDPTVYYVGAASGGIWKTTDAGLHWDPVFDDQPVASIVALAVAPSDPNIVWAGTGEPFIRSHISLGWGMFRSTDAGRTWSRAGLETTGRIARIAIDPRNPDLVVVAALGTGYGPQPDRGIFRTTDGGRSWQKTLFVNDSTGGVDVVMDPNNPRILYAATWQMEIHTWGRSSGGAGSGIWKSTDEGATWRRLSGHGLPTRPFGRVGLATTKANSSVIYALIETGDGVPWNGNQTDSGELWRSDDAGETWDVVSHDRDLAGRTQYYSRVVVEPDDADEAHFLAAAYSRSLDGGRTTVDLGRGESPGGDNHDMWIDPSNGDRMIVANDGGASISTNRGKSWLSVDLPIAQMYHAETDNRIPYTVCGNMQDGPSTCGPSNSKFGIGGRGGRGGSIPRGEWHSVGGGESGWATPDPVDPNVIWSSASGSGSVGGIVIRYDVRSRQAQNVEVWPVSTGGHPAADVKYRFIWDAPLTISPHDHNTVYVGSQFVHRTTDGGHSWQVISPDLTLNDKSKQRISGGLTPDNIGVEYGDVVYAIAESRLTPGLIWAGTNDGLVQLTRDGGKTWTNVTKNIPGMLPWGTVRNIEPSRFDAGTAYITVDGHQENNRDPWVYKTNDFGRTWKLIVNGIPKSPLSYAHCIREDPVRRGLLYLGTENALYVSFDDGESWQPLQEGLPHAPVYWITVQEHFDDLVVATYGRGFYILDNLSALQQLTPAVAASSAHFFTPHPAYRFRAAESPRTMPDDQTVGENPAYGATLDYWLRSPVRGGATLTILDASGKTVRTLRGTNEAGINRVHWDLRGEPTHEALLRTSPLYAPDIVVGREGTRSAPGVGRLSILQPPGRYTVKLSAGGREFTQTVDVLKDPDSGGTAQDIATQVSLLEGLSTDINSAVDMINGIEKVRAQLQTLGQVTAADQSVADVRAMADSLERKFIAVEDSLVQLRLTGQGQDGVRYPNEIAGQLIYLGNEISSSDFAPTAQATEAHTVLRNELQAVKAALDKLLQTDLPAFNELLRQRKLQSIISMED